ncbi:hypothetical protein swp_1191 [Shewanella piezotolerans WP3]|uniref:Uncharacterized protein n=1 Tax=Shewanella piezotolerans (strain WP3 / JCM 13877) TaxID=225849 RepID=B8CKE8_SHEPW|nr:hypothetical protein swp_1191 [Shewanella piezotolerans WP3]
MWLSSFMANAVKALFCCHFIALIEKPLRVAFILPFER